MYILAYSSAHRVTQKKILSFFSLSRKLGTTGGRAEAAATKTSFRKWVSSSKFEYSNFWENKIKSTDDKTNKYINFPISKLILNYDY